MVDSNTLDFSKAATTWSAGTQFTSAQKKLTLRQEFFHYSLQISRLRLPNGLELLAVCNLQTRAHVAGIVPEVDLQALVTKDAFLLSKDLICHLWIEAVKRLDSLTTRVDQRDIDGFVRVRRPYDSIVSIRNAIRAIGRALNSSCPSLAQRNRDECSLCARRDKRGGRREGRN